MKAWLFGLYALILAIVSMFTGELVTFVMLGFILISLHNIHGTLKKILEVKQQEKGGGI